MATLKRGPDRRAGRADETDRAAVDATGARFQRADDVHGARLGRSGDRTAWEERPEQLDQPGSRPEACGDVRGELEHRLVALHREQRGYGDAACLGDASHVVPQEIDDHDVLGLLLGAGTQPVGQDLVLVQVPAAPGGPLHGPQQDLVAGAPEEQLRAGAGDGEAAEVEEGVVGPPLAEGEIAVELERVAVDPSGHPHRQVALVRVSRGDACTDAGDVARVLRGRPRRVPLRTSGRPVRPGGVEGRHRGRFVAEAEPHQRHAHRAGTVHGEVRVQPRRGLVSDVPERPAPRVRRPLDLGQNPDDLVGSLGDQHPVRRRTLHGRPGLQVVEAGPRRPGGRPMSSDGRHRP